MALADRLKNIDGHSTVSKEFRVYTIHGAVLSVLTLTAIAYLVIVEINYNFQKITSERVHVNATSPVGLDVEFDVSLPKVPCSLLNIDANDPAGQSQSLHLDRKHHIWKHPIKIDERTGNIVFIGQRSKLEQGSTFLQEDALNDEIESLKANMSVEEEPEEEEPLDECGSCYGAGEEGECCDTCEDVRRAYQTKGWHLTDPSGIKQCKLEMSQAEKGPEAEGCNVHGVVALDSGGGNFHVAPGRSGSDELSSSVFELLMQTFEQWNVTHTIHKLRFGDEFPGHVNQLDGENRTISDGYAMYQYYFKIVPTKYIFFNGTVMESNQYSVTEHLRHVNPGGGRGLPGVFFFYEIAPLHVEIVEGYRKGWVAFFTSLCAIVGGMVTTMGMVDQMLHSRNSSGGNAGGGLVR